MKSFLQSFPPFPLIQEGQLSVSVNNMSTQYNLLVKEVQACPRNSVVWLNDRQEPR